MPPRRQRAIQIIFLALLLSLLVVSCSTEITAPTATVSKTATLNATATPFVSATAENTLTVTPPLPPTPTLRSITAWDFRLAYVTYQKIKNGSGSTTQIWVLESPYTTPRLILTAAPGHMLSDDGLAWSPDGRQLAFSHYAKERSPVISVVDIFSLQQQQVFHLAKPPDGPGSGAAVEVRSGAWSADGHWLAVSIRYNRSEDNAEHRKTFIVSVTDQSTFELEENSEFVSWLPTPADHFIYLMYPESSRLKKTVQIGKAGQVEPVGSLDLGDYAPRSILDLSVSADGNQALAVSSENQRAFISFLDLQKNESKLLPYVPHIFSQPGPWSPNGEWLTFWQGRDVYFWEFNQASQPADTPLPLVDYISAAIWAPDSSQLLYQDGSALYVVAPTAPQTPSLIVDLDKLGIKSDEDVTTTLWMPALP